MGEQAHERTSAATSTNDEVPEPMGDSGNAVAKRVGLTSIVNGGSHAGEVPVHISYGIIERFSEGLYSSPNKTFEELVSNSYDADAARVWIYLPSDFGSADATVVVIDDGVSMDLQGLRNLWRIGESNKRNSDSQLGRARPIGKFGIGKLATYVLAEQLTYIAYKDDRYLALTMDYGVVSAGGELLSGIELALEVRELTREEALSSLATSLEPFTSSRDKVAYDVLAAADAPPHWTAAILTRLKPTARGIQRGRLRWILRTALPLNPGFQLWLNDEKVTSSKAEGETEWVFTVGENENTLTRNTETPWGPGTATRSTGEAADGAPAGTPILHLPAAGPVWGGATLFSNPLERGKSEDWGRSHGFFVRVRGRLVNLDDEDFSLGPELRHGTLTRFHMEVNADGLDDQVASARESLKESAALTELKHYLRAVFNKARGVSAEVDRSDKISRIAKNGRLADPPPALSQGPLRRMLQRAVDGDNLVRETLGIEDDDAVNDVVTALASAQDDLVRSVILARRDSSARLVEYDPAIRAVVLNQGHPFVNNYIDSKMVAEPLKLLGLAELLTQAYLLDENVPSDVVERVMKRRDNFLRALVQRHPRSAHVIAQQLRDATNNEDALEDAVGDALDLLGFHVVRLGGSGHGTDGVATARLGLRNEPRSDSYAFTYDAKSTKNALGGLLYDEDGTPIREELVPGRIRADTARTSILRVHRERVSGERELPVAPLFTLLVAPGFQGEDVDEGLINAVCQNDGITPLTVDSLARLVELFALQGLNPLDLRELFDLRRPADTAAWLEQQSTSARIPKPPVATLVECLVKYSESKRVTSKDALGAYLAADGHDLREDEVDALVRGLAALAPKSIYSDERVIALNATPSALYREIRESLDEFDTELVEMYKQTFPSDDGAVE